MTNPYSFADSDAYTRSIKLDWHRNMSNYYIQQSSYKDAVCLNIDRSIPYLDNIFPSVLSNEIISYLPSTIWINYYNNLQETVLTNKDEKIHITINWKNKEPIVNIKSLEIHPNCHRAYMTHYMKTWYGISNFQDINLISTDGRESFVDKHAFYNEAWIFKLFFDKLRGNI